jgi:hypothetical protein
MATENIWHGTARITEVVKADKGWSVQVRFYRYGYSLSGLRHVEENLETHVIATGLSRRAAENMHQAVTALGDAVYAQGYREGRK